MRKTNKLLAFAMVFAMVLSTMVMPVSVSAADNFYADGSFENATVENLSSYVNATGTDPYMVLVEDSAIARTGNKAIDVHGATYSSAFAGTAWINGLETGVTYKATGYIKLQSNETEPTAFVKYRDTKANTYEQGATTAVNGTTWTPVSVTFTATSDQYQLQFFVYNRKNYYLDDITVEEYVEPITDVFPNGSFENSTADNIASTLGGSSNTVTLVTDSTKARTGENCAVVTGATAMSASANSGWFGGLETGATYKATAYVKLVNAGTANTVFINYRDTNAGNNPVRGPIFSGITADAWTPISYEFTPTSPNYQLQFCNYDKLDYYIDDITVKKVVANNPAWGTFEYVGTAAEAGVSGSGCTATLATDGQGAFGSQNYIKVTGRGYQGANIIANFPLEVGKAYKLSGYVRLADGAADTQVTPEANYAGNGAVFRGTPVTAKAGVWTKFEVELAPNEIFRGKYAGHSLALKAVAPDGVDLWYDNFTLEEIAMPALTMTEDFEVAEAVAIDSVQTITVDFSHDAYNFSGRVSDDNGSDQAWSNLAASNFAVDNDATLDVQVVNNKQAVLTISGFAYNTTYTVTATDLTDYYGNTIADAVVATFTTEEEPVVVLPDNLVEGKVPRGGSCDVVDNGDGTYTVANQTWASSYKVFIDGITGEVGKKYLAVAYVKKAAGTADGDAASLVGGVLSTDASKIEVSMKCNSETIGDDWTKVTGLLEVTSVDGVSTSGSINIGVHGGTASDAELFMVKGFELRVFEETTLDINTSYIYKMVDNSLYLHNPSMTGQSIYVYAVNVADDGTFESATMLTDWFNQNGVGSYELPEADKYFIWDRYMTPLSSPITLTLN